MRIAALVKQVAGPDGPEMEPLSRRAVAQGVELAAAVGDGICTMITVGDATAEDSLREALAWGRTYSGVIDGVLLRDPDAAQRDKSARASLLAAAIELLGPFDLVLLGAESHRAAIHELGPQLAKRLELPFAGPARYLSMQARTLHVRCEQDDGFVQVKLSLPAVISCAEALIDPCEAPPAARALVPADLIRVLTDDELAT